MGDIARDREDCAEQKYSTQVRTREETGELARRVDAKREPFGLAVRGGLGAPDRQQRADDAVGTTGVHAGGGSPRDEPEEDRLHLVGRGVAGRAQAGPPHGVALLAQRGLAQPPPVELDHLGVERLDTEARILVGVGPSETVVHVHRRDAVAERAERMPETGRVRAARDQAGDLAAGRDQVVPADVPLDSGENVVHAPIVPEA